MLDSLLEQAGFPESVSPFELCGKGWVPVIRAASEVYHELSLTGYERASLLETVSTLAFEMADKRLSCYQQVLVEPAGRGEALEPRLVFLEDEFRRDLTAAATAVLGTPDLEVGH